jgi:lipid-A-disaccharide synthase
VIRPPRVFLSAGEASGDRLGAGLARELRALRPDVALVGLGGDEMAEAGVRLVRHASSVAVMGIFEVLAHLPLLVGAMQALENALDDESPDIVVPVDFPDFNLRFAARARARGIPVVYYVSPQVWAWRAGRAREIARIVQRMLVLFPFEAEFYERAGIPVTFVGHPAAARRGAAARADVRAIAGLHPDRPLLALLPGSRRKEVRRLFPVLLGALASLRRERSEIQAVVPRARTLPPGFLESIAARAGEPVTILDGSYPEILDAADAAAVASGTATLDAAMSGLPSVVVYRMQPLSYLLARRLVRIEHIALPNLIAGRRLLPELVQDECSADRVASELARFLDDPGAREHARQALLGLRGALRGDGAFRRAAEAVLAELPEGLR